MTNINIKEILTQLLKQDLSKGEVSKILNNPNDLLLSDYTNFEIRNLVRNKDWFENTIWLHNSSKYGGKPLTLSDLKKDFGIEKLYD